MLDSGNGAEFGGRVEVVLMSVIIRMNELHDLITFLIYTDVYYVHHILSVKKFCLLQNDVWASAEW